MRALNKAERLLEIQQLLLEWPDGLRQSEIADRLGVHRSTIHRYLPELTTQFHVFERPDGRLAVDREASLARLRVTVHEATAVFLAARLLHRQSDERNPHAISALIKLARALRRVAPPMSRGIEDTARCMQSAPGREDRRFVAVLEALTRGWVLGQWVEVGYRKLGAERPSRGRIAPYLIEATGPGLSTYVLGLRQPPGEIRVLKVERMVSARLTPERFEMPEDLDVSRVFENAWGIWRPAEGGPVEVVLLFDTRVAERVREARWHGSEQTEERPDGALLWRARIGDVTEIRPWVRSWGPDVEVLAPSQLREQVAGDLRAAAARYERQAP